MSAHRPERRSADRLARLIHGANAWRRGGTAFAQSRRGCVDSLHIAVLLVFVGCGDRRRQSSAECRGQGGISLQLRALHRMAGGASKGPLTLCVLGDPEVAASLDSLIGDRPINGRDVSVASIATFRIVRTCHLLYVAGDDKARTTGALEAVASLHVFTVGDGEHFAARTRGGRPVPRRRPHPIRHQSRARSAAPAFASARRCLAWPGW